MSLFRNLVMIVVMMILSAGMYGCKEEGPAERAGKKIDNAIEDAKRKLHDATK